mmetsp:Transcript_29568/g.58585  ORF Transcript_29568/g.58585 Transcript_29568/m.58585 type:complete len:215 (-) Transcript_29568:884-1528(-)
MAEAREGSRRPKPASAADGRGAGVGKAEAPRSSRSWVLPVSRGTSPPASFFGLRVFFFSFFSFLSFFFFLRVGEGGEVYAPDPAADGGVGEGCRCALWRCCRVGMTSSSPRGVVRSTMDSPKNSSPTPPRRATAGGAAASSPSSSLRYTVTSSWERASRAASRAAPAFFLLARRPFLGFLASPSCPPSSLSWISWKPWRLGAGAGLSPGPLPDR